jgi:tRNA (uracil-5-)-methyltransferase
MATETQTPVVRLSGESLVACYPEKYEELFLEKRKKLSSLLNNWPVDNIQSYESPRDHYRMRTNFQLWHDNPKQRTPEGVYYAMFDGEGDFKKPHEIKSFPRGTHRINELMDAIMHAIQTNPVIFQHLFEVRFVTTKLNEESIVVLCYKRPLSKEWLPAAESLAQTIGHVKIIGRSRKVMQITQYNNPFNSEFIKERLTVHNQSFDYYQTEGAFSQPNAVVCEKMIEWSLDQTKGSQESDLLELYCGGGTFTAPLSTNFRKVLATEISKASVTLARKCFEELNHLTNITVVRLSSEEFTEFYTGKNDFASRFTHLPERKLDLTTDWNISTVFVDPPRAGLDAGTRQLISAFQKIVYISCNPITLARDCQELLKTHEMKQVAAFDQFPYTDHLESGVVLVRRADAPIVDLKKNFSSSTTAKEEKQSETKKRSDDEEADNEETEEDGNPTKRQKTDL